MTPDPRKSADGFGRDSPVFSAGRSAAFEVARRRSLLSQIGPIVALAALGGAVFLSLSAQRARRQSPTPPAPAAANPDAPRAAPAPAQAVARLSEPASVISPNAVPAQLPPPSVAAAGPDASTRLHAPVVIIDQPSTPPAALPAATAAQAPAPSEATSAEERFEAKVTSAGASAARASRMRDLAFTVPQGTVIPAVLETAINSDLPGSTRAVVAQDVRGFSGDRVLIPRGSKLVGQYRSGVAYGQSRAFVVWSRLITPEGVSIDIGSPAADPLGRGGLPGETDSHFFQRFGGAILLSVLNAGLEAAAQSGSGTSIVIGSPIQATALAAQAPSGGNIPVTVKVMQGSPLQVFLVRDLDFADVFGAKK